MFILIYGLKCVTIWKEETFDQFPPLSWKALFAREWKSTKMKNFFWDFSERISRDKIKINSAHFHEKKMRNKCRKTLAHVLRRCERKQNKKKVFSAKTKTENLIQCQENVTRHVSCRYSSYTIWHG